MTNPSGKQKLIYVTANLVLGGGDQILLAHARALQPTPFQIALFSLEPFDPEQSLAADLRAQGVDLQPTLPEHAISRLAFGLLPSVVAISVLRVMLILARGVWAGVRRTKAEPRAALWGEIKAALRQPGARARKKVHRQMLRWRIRQYARQQPVCGIHVFHAAACQALGALTYSLNIPSFYTEILTPKSYAAWAPELRTLLPRITEIVVPAETIGEHLRDMFSLTHSFHVIPFTVPIPGMPDKPIFRPERFHYGIVARLSEEKGHRVLLEAAPRIQERCPQARLIFAGDGPLRAELEETLQRLGLTQHIQFLGAFRPPDLPRIFEEFDIVVLPSRVEGMPHVLVEAMAFGKPVVATPVGAVPEMVQNDVNGFLVPVGEAAELAERISLLLLDTALRERLGRQARNIYEERYDYDSVLQKIRALYDPLLNN